MSKLVRFLQELVALPSINPAFLEDRPELTGEQRVAEFLLAWSARAGLEVETMPVLEGRFNMVATLRSKGQTRQRVVLAPHLDTASVPDETLLTPRRKGDRIYGRGTCDTKGCVAAMLEAVARLAKSGQRPDSTEIVFLGLVDEESGQEGSRAAVDAGFSANLAIVGEPTQLKVVTAHKGDVWLHIDTVGKAAHGARPELGKNAIHEMSRVVSLLETEYAESLKLKRHPLLRHATINVGTIEGGKQPNIVPDACRISIDRRTLPGEDLESVMAELRALFRAHGLKARLTNMRGGPCVALETDSNQPLVRALMRTTGQRKPVGVDYFCDAAVLSAGGIPSVVFGPGDIAQAHTADEWIAIESLERGADQLEQFLRTLP